MTKIITSKTERKAADRKFMADAVVELANRLGLHYVREEFTENREIYIRLRAPSGLCVYVSLEGRSVQPDIHVLSWNMHYESKLKLNDATFGGNVNPHHKQKATYIAYGFEQLMIQLEKGFKMANDGSAYLP